MVLVDVTQDLQGTCVPRGQRLQMRRNRIGHLRQRFKNWWNIYTQNIGGTKYFFKMLGFKIQAVLRFQLQKSAKIICHFKHISVFFSYKYFGAVGRNSRHMKKSLNVGTLFSRQNDLLRSVLSFCTGILVRFGSCWRTVVPCSLCAGQHKDHWCLQDSTSSAAAFMSFSLLLVHGGSWASAIS